MSQRAVEAALGKLLCDDGFRHEFYQDAEATLARVGLVLTPVELSSLYKIKLEEIEDFAAHLDERVRRAGEAVQRRRARSTAGRG